VEKVAFVRASASVEGIADDGVAEVFEVDADLVRAARSGAAFNE